MLKKTLVVGFALVATPILLSAIQWGNSSQGQRNAAELEELTLTVQKLEARLDDARRQLEESLDMLEQDLARTSRHRNCTPSRNSLVYYQWFDKNGHPKRAERTLAKWLKRYGRSERRLIEFSWGLMTERSSSGKFDRAALRIAEHAAKNGSNHRAYDVLALAKFLDGQVGAAIELQKRAVAEDNDRSDYLRRLRMYEAAERVATTSVATDAVADKPAISVATIVEGSAEEPDEDEPRD